MKRLLFALVAVALIALVFLLWPAHDGPVETITVTATVGQGLAQPVRQNPHASGAKVLLEPPTEISHLADNLNSPTGTIKADLHILADVLENFRTNFPHDGNPVGDNVEITAALTGQNKLHYAAIPPNHPAINPAGELCDRWGTPFFFHAESGTKMGIRSAGPDKKMWTADDVVLEP